MDAGTLYLRLFMGGKSFESSELDLLAEKMKVSGLLSGNTDQRYFVTKANMAALSLGNKLLFGASYYRALTERQRLAVAAHEFGHLLGKDGAHRRKRIVAPAAVASSLLAAITFIATGSALVLECTLAATFLLCVALFSKVYAEQYRRQEMRSDELAASFVSGEALVEAIRAAESMAQARSTRTISQRIGIRRHPDTSLRVEAILKQNPAS